MDSEDNIGYQLTENFIFFQDIVKKPEEVFDCRSQEYKLANAWLNKLSMFGFETIEDMRLRNVFMSHLVACLNYGKLTGPFTSMPNPGGVLDKSDFLLTQDKPRQAVCPRPKPGMSASQKACLDHKGGGGRPCECDYVCCDQNEQKKDCSGMGAPSSFDHICGYMMQYVNVPTCLDSQLRATVEHNQYHTHDVFTNCADVTAATTSAAFYGHKADEKCVGGAFVAASNCTTCGENLELDHQFVRSQITTLLDAIASELRGEQSPGTNDYLEYELARYKNFKLQFPQVAEKIAKLKAEQSLRSYFLLNLQNDLVKLLNDCCLKPEVNSRPTLNMH